jgi:hypothetical protein
VKSTGTPCALVKKSLYEKSRLGGATDAGQTLNLKLLLRENGRKSAPEELQISRDSPSPLKTHSEVTGEV